LNKNNNDRIKQTLNYYEKNADGLIQRYESADLSKVQNYILNFVKKDDYILDIGFGSGREIDFLIKNGFKNVYGIDGCKEFVQRAKLRFNSENFYYSVLPEINLPENLKFDFIYSIAVWMHLPSEIYEESIKNINKILKNRAKVLLSYSLDERNEKERYFQKVDEDLLDKIFEKFGMKKIDEIITVDSLNRKIKWKSVVYGRDKT
jgi:cyclopropane fatty-acyl-phospholipid synthase-like methyltransferase